MVKPSDGVDQGCFTRTIGPNDPEQFSRIHIQRQIIDGRNSTEIFRQVLDAHQLALRGGHHCAQPLLAALGVEACTRASIALYNDETDIQALLDGLDFALEALR